MKLLPIIAKLFTIQRYIPVTEVAHVKLKLLHRGKTATIPCKVWIEESQHYIRAKAITDGGNDVSEYVTVDEVRKILKEYGKNTVTP